MSVLPAAAAEALPDIKPWVGRLVRLGYLAKGLIYLLIGTLALRLVLGLRGGRLTDASGVLRTMLRQPFGAILLTVIGVGILAYAGWYLFEAITDARHKGSDWKGRIDRALTVIKAVVYGGIGWEAMRIVLSGHGSSASADDYARETMRFPLGGLFLALVGLGIAVYGVLEIWKAWQARFDEDLDQPRLRREAPWVLQVGRWGVGARGVILTLIGFGLVRAGLEERATRARGYAESLATLLSQPSGQWLVAVVAAGLVCFGVFQLLHARYARLA